jgi:CRISPR-associated exonuclease Cas4
MYDRAARRSVLAFTDLATAAYCPRQLYYRRKHDDFGRSSEAARVCELAYRYPELLDETRELPPDVAVTPTQFRTNLACASERLDAWDELVDPPARDVLLEGREARGIAHKVLDEPLAPSLVFAGDPPPEGVWQPATVRLVAAAKALSRERETPVERAFAEFPTHGVVREIRLTTRRKALYRRTVRAVEAMDEPPARVANDEKCVPCEYRTECGTRTRSLRLLLGL